jgi:outer membrane protein OmpA-like peptidoglycan-associated protein
MRFVRLRTLALGLTLLTPFPALAQQSPPLNVSGKWEASAAGFYGQLRQTGTVISGRCYTGQNCLIRGAFVGDHVMITARWDYGSQECHRGTFIAPNTGKLSPLVGKWYGEPDLGDGLTRVSADAGEPVSYPYAEELKLCGDLVTYELSFDVNSAQIKNADAPVLPALAAVLKTDPAAKLAIIGHTDATGAADKNKKLSLDRAQSVKTRLVELCGCDPGRVRVEGMGPDQPLESNDTPAGRALNRRVEITIAH